MSKRPGDNNFYAPVLRSAKMTRTSSSWVLLPTEIRLLILDEISRQKYPGWSLCAAVCKEWQAVVERENFRRLRLQESCIEKFENVAIRQRHLVQYICLNIELPRYTCRSCQQFESLSWMSRHSAIIRDTILKLFSVLSIWEPTGCLTLELHAYSLSDSEHWFKHYHFGPENEDVGDFAQQQEATTRWHDPQHGWVNGQQVEAPRTPTIMRLFSPMCLSLPKDLPEVRAVTGFLIRRQLRRQISPEALQLLWARLPQLQTIIYEPWRVWRRTWKIWSDRELASVIQNALPSHVRTVSIFEEFNDQLALALRRDTRYFDMIDTNPSADPLLVRALASKSRNFERLSISYMIDAQQFFKACQLSYTWDHLQSLTLTSSVLARTAPGKEISAFLHDASLAALHMPQLESMVFWNSKQGDACAVIYQRNKASKLATLTWRGTWDFELSHDVVNSWQKVASDSNHLRIRNERVQGLINCHGDAVHHLRLPTGVIDPVSLWQIRQEGMMQRIV